MLDRVWPKQDPRIWFEMPRSIIEAYVQALPRIKAEESLRLIRDLSVGTGAQKREVAKKVIRDLQRDLRSGLPQRAKTVVNRKQAEIVFAQMGIGIRRKEPAANG